MAKVIMGIGIPGSGKTTILKPLALKNAYTCICPDDIREEFSGDAQDHSRNSEVWQEAYKRTAGALRKGETVVFDATFVKDFERKNFMQFARENGASKVQGVFADVTLEIADERNRQRERVVPPLAMDRMDRQLKSAPPALEDGFDALFEINEFQELVHAEMPESARSPDFKMKFQ